MTINGVAQAERTTTTTAVLVPASLGISIGGTWAGSYTQIGYLDYFQLGTEEYRANHGWGTILQEVNSGSLAQGFNMTQATSWVKKDTATPHNFNNGFYLYENGVAGEELRYPIQLENAYLVSDTYFASTNTTKWTINLKQPMGTNAVRFMFFSQSTALQNGYCMYIESNGNIRLEKFVSWAISTLAQSMDAAIDLYSQDSTLVIERTVDGEFTVSVNDVEIITVTDTTFTTSGYFVTRAYYGSKVFIESILDESDEAYALPYTQHPVYLDGYTLSGYYPPLVFGNMESGFKVPYNATIAAADTEGKLYDGTTPKEIKFADLVAGGFGNKIKYAGTVVEGFRKFCVKK